MFMIVTTGRGRTTKLHAQTLDGRRLCRTKYSRETGPAQLMGRMAANDHACSTCFYATQELPRVQRREHGVPITLSVRGLPSMDFWTEEAFHARLSELGVGAYRHMSSNLDGGRIRPRAEIEDQQSRLASAMAAVKYHGD